MQPAPSFDPSRLTARLGDMLSLEGLSVECRGFARATQVLRIGGDEIARDRVLIEEVTYPIVDEMNAEVNSMTIKMGMFQPFLRTSTYPPKYYYTDRATLWLVTSVPPVSLAAVLDEFERRFPAHYTWDRPAWVSDMARAVREGVREWWRQRRRPFAAIRAGVASYRACKPQRLTPGERMRFAAMLVDAVRPKHAAGIYHNNLTPRTIFFSDPSSPRVLNNYTGTVPPVMEEYVPEALLKRRRDQTFGDQSIDTYCLALMVYELVTGQRLQGPRFVLDEPLEVHIPDALQRSLGGKLAAYNWVVDSVREAYAAVAHVVALARATFDESRFANFRVLTRASGSLVRSIPGLRAVLDVWFPSEVALVLRSILDSRHNEHLFGPRTRLNRSLPVKRNANLAYLRAALPPEPFSGKGTAGRVIQELIGRTQEQTERDTGEDEPVPPLRLRLGRAYLLRYAFTALALFMVCAWSTRHSPAGRMAQAATVADTSAAGSGCTARLLPNRKHPGVYKVSGLRRRCRTGDIAFAPGPDSAQTLPQSLGSTYIQLYAAKREEQGYGEVTPIRLCPSTSRGCEEGEFYRATGLSGLAERFSFAEDDLVAFDRQRLEEFLGRAEK